MENLFIKMRIVVADLSSLDEMIGDILLHTISLS